MNEELKRIRSMLSAATGFEDDDQEYIEDARRAIDALIEQQPADDFELRGKLASLKCWPRLKEAEADDLVRFVQALEQQPAAYPLPEDLYDSKDWRSGSYAERVEWLHTMYETKKRELDAYLERQPADEPVAWARKTEKKLRITTMNMTTEDGWRPLVYRDTRLQPAPPAIPEVMKLVPVEPTEAMVTAYDQAQYNDNIKVEAKNVWVAMLAAAAQQKGGAA